MSSSLPNQQPISDANPNTRLRTAIWLIISLLAMSCGGAQKVDREERGTLRFEGDPQEASLSVDETRLGPIGMFEQKGVLLRPGEHRIVIRAAGFFPEYRLVHVQANTTQVVKIKLRPLPK